MVGLAGIAAASPSNDQCANAIEVTPAIGTFTASAETNDATSTGDPGATCGFQVDHAIWYRYTNSTSGQVSVAVSLENSDFDTVLQVWEDGASTCDLGDGSTTCDDDYFDLQSYVQFTAQPGKTYEIEVGGYYHDSGDVQLSATMTALTYCGDGGVDSGEQCDDGNNVDGDGCSASCNIEPGYQCAGAPSVCATICGDGITAGAELCDDGNTDDGDGCSATCQPEYGYSCAAGDHSHCVSSCGDGVKASNEQCDDGANADGDGCSRDCKVELGWSCAGVNPSTCGNVCGDGVWVKGSLTEQCDDGNNVDGDGCSHDCKVEPGYVCDLSPSRCVTEASIVNADHDGSDDNSGDDTTIEKGPSVKMVDCSAGGHAIGWLPVGAALSFLRRRRRR